MKKLLPLLALLSFSLFGQQEDCYRVVFDHTGRFPDQTISVDNSACMLRSSLPTFVRDSFSVVSFAVNYLKQFTSEDFLNQAFLNVKSELDVSARYHLAFARYTRKETGEYRIKVFLNLPTNESVACLNSVSLSWYNNQLQSLVNSHVEGNIENNYRMIERECIDLLASMINQGCLVLNNSSQIADFFNSYNFDSIKVVPGTINTISSNRLAQKSNETGFDSMRVDSRKVLYWNTSQDFYFGEKSENFVDHFLNKITDLDDTLFMKGFYTSDDIFSQPSIDDLRFVFNNTILDDNIKRPKFWIHIAGPNNESSEATVYYKQFSNNILNALEDQFEYILENEYSYGPNIVQEGVTHYAFTDNEIAAIRIVGSLNRVYKRVYSIDYNAFRFQELEEEVVFERLNPNYSWLTSWWTGVEKFVLSEPNIGYRLLCESTFDWNTDEYTKAIFDMFYTNRNFYVRFRQRNLHYYRGETLEDIKGFAGKRSNGGFVYLSDHLFNQTSSAGWNQGGTLLHEMILHMHHVGSTFIEISPGVRVLESTHRMQTLYGLSLSLNDHLGTPILAWPLDEKNRLDNLRNSF